MCYAMHIDAAFKSSGICEAVKEMFRHSKICHRLLHKDEERQLLIAIFTLWNTLIIFLHIDIDILDSQSLSLPHGGSKKNVLNLLLLTLWWLVSVVLQYTEPLTLTERVRSNHSCAFKRIRKVCGKKQ